jgi:MFS family permease
MTTTPGAAARPQSSTPAAAGTRNRQSSITRTFRALGHRNYRLFWTGQLVSQTGTWMRTTANAWLVLQLTGSALALGAITAMQFLPILLFSLFGGVLADRLPKRQTLLVTQSIMCGQAVAVAVLTATGQIQMSHLYILTGILGCALAIDNPTRQAFVSELVGPDDLPNAVALNSSVFNATRIIGPSVAGVLIAAFGMVWPFALNATSYLAVIGMLLLMRPEQFFLGKRRARSGVFSEIGEGFRYIRNTPDALLICLLMAVLGLFGYNFTVVLPLIARDVLHTGAAGFGALTSAMGVGSLIAALGIAYHGRATRRTLLLGAAGFSVLLGSIALSPLWLLTAPLLVALGLCSIVFTATANTRLQLLAPPELRGRVMSIYMLLFGGTTPLGGLIIGSLAERQGIQRAQIEVSLVCILGVILGLIYAYRQRARLAPDAAPARQAAAA